MLSEKDLRFRIKAVIIFHAFWYIIYLLSLPFIFLYWWGSYYTLALSLLLFIAWRLRGGCPILRLENRYREKTNPPSDYKGTFLSHYLSLLLSITVTPRIARTLNISFLIVVSGLAVYNIYFAK